MTVFPFSRPAAALTAVLLLLSSCAPGNSPAEASEFVFDTYASYKVCGADAAHTLDLLSQRMNELNGIFDLCYDVPADQLPENAVYTDCLELGRSFTEQYGPGVSMTCGSLTSLWGISDGKYHIPDENEIAAALAEVTDGTWLDFGAAAKGYACDEARRILDTTGTQYAVISFSSSTLLYGQKPDGLFRAGITHPDGNGYLGIIESEAAFISTSGGYERYFEADGQRFTHILDLETGRPAETDLVSVTVIVPASAENGGILSDWLSTLIYMEGTEELDKWMEYSEFSVIAADESGKIYTDFDGFTPDSGSGYFLQ